MRIASTLGGAALCAALVLFFLRIWGSILLPVQVAILALTPILLLGATEYAARRERTLYYASLLGLLAVAAFVLDLSALGATFNIAPSRGALLAWGVFSLLVAYAWRIGLPQIAGVAILIGYTAACLAAWAGSYWADCMNRPENFLPGAALAFSVPFVLSHRSAPGNRGTGYATPELPFEPPVQCRRDRELRSLSTDLPSGSGSYASGPSGARLSSLLNRRRSSPGIARASACSGPGNAGAVSREGQGFQEIFVNSSAP